MEKSSEEMDWRGKREASLCYLDMQCEIGGNDCWGGGDYDRVNREQSMPWE